MAGKRPEPRHPATVGVIALVRLLEPRGTTIAELQDHCALSRSGAYRMVAAVEAAGVPVSRIREDERGIVLRAALPSRTRPAVAPARLHRRWVALPRRYRYRR